MTTAVNTGFDYEAVVTGLNAEIKAANDEKRRLEEMAYAKKKEGDEARRQLFYYMNVAKMAGWSRSAESEREYWNWYMGMEHGRSQWSKREWSKTHYFRMVGFEFNITIAERFDLKRDKFEVEIRGRSEVPSAGGYDVSWYSDHDYVKKTYKNVDFKFRTLADAEACMTEWKERLIADHNEELQKQLEMIANISDEQAKAANNSRR